MHICTLCFRKIIICLIDGICFPVHADTFTVCRAWEEPYNIRKKVCNPLCLKIGSHCYRNDISIHYFRTHRGTDLLNGKLLSGKIAVQEFLTGLCH